MYSNEYLHLSSIGIAFEYIHLSSIGIALEYSNAIPAC